MVTWKQAKETLQNKTKQKNQPTTKKTYSPKTYRWRRKAKIHKLSQTLKQCRKEDNTVHSESCILHSFNACIRIDKEITCYRYWWIHLGHTGSLQCKLEGLILKNVANNLFAVFTSIFMTLILSILYSVTLILYRLIFRLNTQWKCCLDWRFSLRQVSGTESYAAVLKHKLVIATISALLFYYPCLRAPASINLLQIWDEEYT